MGLARKIATVGALALLGTLIGGTTAWAGGGGHCDPTEGSDTTVELAGSCFTATTSFVEPGETVTFVNRDPFLHNVSGSGWGHYEDMVKGDTYSTSFPDQGVFAFACTLHPGMTGSIVVGDGAQATTARYVEPASAAPPGTGTAGWIPAAALGLLIGAAAGAGIVRLRGDRNRRLRPTVS